MNQQLLGFSLQLLPVRCLLSAGLLDVLVVAQGSWPFATTPQNLDGLILVFFRQDAFSFRLHLVLLLVPV